jgi:hypothetical protein
MIICSFDHCQNNILRSQSLNWDDIFIDEFHHIMWELQANLIPKFGYCSFKFDDVAQGKSLVQGQLAINFVSPGYLIGALLGATAVTTGSASGSSASSDTEIQMQQLLIEAATLSETNTPATVARMAQIQQQAHQLATKMGPSGVQNVCSAMRRGDYCNRLVLSRSTRCLSPWETNSGLARLPPSVAVMSCGCPLPPPSFVRRRPRFAVSAAGERMGVPAGCDRLHSSGWNRWLGTDGRGRAEL